MWRVDAAIHAPVDPAVKKACASPSRTSWQPTTIEESFIERTAETGSASMGIVSVVGRAEQRSSESAGALTTSSGPDENDGKIRVV